MKMKSKSCHTTQIMKKCFNSLFVTLLVLAALIISTTTVLAQSNCVCAICGRSCDEVSRSGHKPGYSCYVAKKPTPGSSGGYSGGSPQQQIPQMIFQSFFDSLFAQPDTSAQDEIERQKAIKLQQEEEQKRQAAIQRYYDLQNEEAMRKQMEQNAKITKGAEVLSRTQRVGSGDELKPFSFGNPKLDIKSLSSQTYPAPPHAWDQALCAAYFSNLAKQSTKDIDARFYADQAQRVMVGEPTYMECMIPKVSNEKLAKRMEEVKKVYDEMNVKIKDLQDIEAKLTETREKIKDAEIKKEEATAKLTEIQNRAATASPEEKAKVDDSCDLGCQAQKQLQDAEQELNQAKQSEKDALNKKEQLENELENMKSQVQAKIQAGDK